MRPALKSAVLAATAVAFLAGADLKTVGGLTAVHEWGTFSSVAGEDGSPVAWAPLAGPADLPCFVERSPVIHKVGTVSPVRMETPVLYFYADRVVTASVRVEFPRGYITEWYPHRSDGDGHIQSIEWDGVQVTPGSKEAYPATAGLSHYYAARNTDASPLRVGEQAEKMLFYRGLGNFPPPLRARYTAAGKLEISNTGAEPIPFVVAFENQSGRIGYRIAEQVTGSISMDQPELTRDAAALRENLAVRLAALGLYPKEARAMVATWADSWFNQGSRVFYIMPRAAVDRLLPLAITPEPAAIQRVFVGREEVLSPRTRQTLEHAVGAGDSATLAEFTRFLQPFLAQMQHSPKGFALSPAAKKYVESIAGAGTEEGNGYGSGAQPGSECVE